MLPPLSTYARLRRSVFRTLEDPQHQTPFTRAINRFLVALILANIAAVILESVGTLQARYGAVFETFELVSLSVFILEYALRLWVSNDTHRYAEPIFGRVRYFFSPLALIDLAAILPSLLTGFASDFRFLRAVRVLRTLRIWKLTRYADPIQKVRLALSETADQMVAVGAVLIVIVIVSSGLMYVVEYPAQPEKFGSVFDSMWWTLQTLTMISYDDMTPITPIGKFLGIVIGLIGIGMFAMPAGILAGAFIEQIKDSRKEKQLRCPHCGREK